MFRDPIFEHNRQALLRLIAAAFAVAGLVPGGPHVARLAPLVRKQLLRILGPAESALRRLIAIAARELKVTLGPKRPAPSRPIPKGDGSSDRVPPFALFDPRKWFAELAERRPRKPKGRGPWISSFDDPRPNFDPVPPPPTEPSALGLCKRLQALHRAAQDIPGQAKRLARLIARRQENGEPPKRTQPLRPGPPPGHRQKHTHEIDIVLSECHILARMKPPVQNSS